MAYGNYGAVVQLSGLGAVAGEWYLFGTHPGDSRGPWNGPDAFAAQIVADEGGGLTYDVYDDQGNVIRRESGLTFAGATPVANPFTPARMLARRRIKILGLSLPVWAWGGVAVAGAVAVYFGYRSMRR